MAFTRIDKIQVHNSELLKIMFESEGCPDKDSFCDVGFYMRLHEGENPTVELRNNCGWNTEGHVHTVPESYVKEKIKVVGMRLHGIDESEIAAIGCETNMFFNTINNYYLEVPRRIDYEE